MAKKKGVPSVSSTIKNLLSFQFAEDHVQDGEEHIFFLRIHSPNMDILSQSEQTTHVHKLQAILDSVDIAFDIFAMDKAESLDAVKKYYEACLAARQEFAFVFNDAIRKLDAIDTNSASVQRAFYLAVHVRDRQRYELFAQQVRGKLDYSLARGGELEVIMRNYLLHEYVPTPVYSLEREFAARQQTSGNGDIHVRFSKKERQKYAAMAANEQLLSSIHEEPILDEAEKTAPLVTAAATNREPPTAIIPNEKPLNAPDGKEALKVCDAGTVPPNLMPDNEPTTPVVHGTGATQHPLFSPADPTAPARPTEQKGEFDGKRQRQDEGTGSASGGLWPF